MTSRRRAPLLGAVAGVLVGTLAAGILVTTGVLQLPAGADPEAPGRLLSAWQRHRMATYTMDAEVVRIKPYGGRLTTLRTEVQRPPDHVIKEHGSVAGRIGEQQINCSAEPTGQVVCGATGGEAPPWEDMVTHELAVLRGYVHGEQRLYDVTEDEGCFVLQLVRFEPDSPYGLGARLCFDELTGALTQLDRELEGGITEQRRATYVSPSVDPADLSLELEPDHLSVADKLEAASPGTTAAEAGDDLAEELAALDDDAFFERAAGVVTGREVRAIVLEAIRRMEDGRIGINDPRWLDERGRPLPTAPPLVRALLEAGYHGPQPP